MFELESPWVLLLLILPLIIWFFLPKAKSELPGALKIPFYQALASIIEQEKIASFPKLLFLPTLIWIFLVLALTGPRWVGAPQPLARAGYNIMLALDLSDSMRIEDMVLHGQAVSRLSVVKQAAVQFVKDRKEDKIGLILFGTRAYLQTPLTYDKHNILMRIEDATPGLAGVTTSIGDAIGLAIKRLDKTPKKGRILILLTDGANNSGVLDPLKAAELAKEEGIKIYTIGLGGELEADVFSPSVAADLDEETLKKIAKLTQGLYFRASDLQSLQAIYQRINQLETINQKQANIIPQKDYYPWLVALALALCCYWLGSRISFKRLHDH